MVNLVEANNELAAIQTDIKSLERRARRRYRLFFEIADLKQRVLAMEKQLKKIQPVQKPT